MPEWQMQTILVSIEENYIFFAGCWKKSQSNATTVQDQWEQTICFLLHRHSRNMLEHACSCTCTAVACKIWGNSHEL